MTFKLTNGEEVHPITTFNKGYSHIIVDDGCYVIVNGDPGKLGSSAWIFREALEVLKTLPIDPSEVERNALQAYYPKK